MSSINDLIELYDQEKFTISQFHKRIINFFNDNPILNTGPLPIVHSVKYRMKDRDHLKEKLERKSADNPITRDNFFDRVTDLAGIRVLHLYPSQFEVIHSLIIEQISSGEWYLFEKPVAYTWDPDSKGFYESLEILTKIKPSYYTSVHYVIQPKEESRIKCEIQIRTLFEEIWGEIDHSMNYPKPCESISCREQLKVLAQLTSTGTRLAESIFISQNEFKTFKEKNTD